MKKLYSNLIALVLFAGFVLPFTSGWGEETDYSQDSYAEPAIDGNCPVCVYKGKIMRGNDNFVTQYRGKIYYFPGLEQQKMFLNNPEIYVADLESKYRNLKRSSEGSHRYEGSH